MTDPVKGCPVYIEMGCAHVDGFLCDYHDCSMVADYWAKHIDEEVLRVLGVENGSDRTRNKTIFCVESNRKDSAISEKPAKIPPQSDTKNP